MDWLANMICMKADEKFSEVEDQSGKLCMLLSVADKDMKASDLAKAIYNRGYNAQIEREPECHQFMWGGKVPKWKVRLSRRKILS